VGGAGAGEGVQGRVRRLPPTGAPAAASPLVAALKSLLGPRGLLLGGTFIAICAIFFTPVEDPDFWWHITTGRWIVEHSSLPHHDLFTFTARNHVWTDHEYLTEIVMWLVFHAGGLIGISVLFGLVTLAGFVVLYLSSRGSRAQPSPYVIVGLAIALGAMAGAPIWGPRAQMITFFLACLELHWLRGYLAGRSRAIYWFPLVMVLWANLHGGWVIGFGFLAVAIVAVAGNWLLEPGSVVHPAQFRRIGLIGAVSLVAVMATPHGPSLYLYPFETQGSAAQQSLIVEWFSPNFHDNGLRAFEVMIFALLAGFALKRPTLYEFLLSAAVLALALQNVRHVALFVAATTPILALHWSEVWRQESARRGWRVGLDSTPRVMRAVTALVLAVILVATVARIGSNYADQKRRTESNYPVHAAAWLRDNPQACSRFYNQYGWGGYLIYDFYPAPENRRVFIFGEAALMGDALLRQYQDVQTLRSNWVRVLDDYQVDCVVYNHGEALSNVLATEPGWEVAYPDDGVAIIYRRTSAR
jgi:hypothetical protein